MENVKNYTELLEEAKIEMLKNEKDRLSKLFDSRVTFGTAFNDKVYHPEFKKFGFLFRGQAEVERPGYSYAYSLSTKDDFYSILDIRLNERELAKILNSENPKLLFGNFKKAIKAITECFQD